MMSYNSPIANYSSKGINEIFSTKNKFAKWAGLWQAQIKTFVGMGVAPKEAFDEISRVMVDDTLVRKFQEYEAITHHDINAGIKYLSELCPTAAKYIHAGLTSMDIDDNGRVLQQREALDYVLDKCSYHGLHDFKILELKGKKPSGAIGTTQDLSKYLGSEEKAAEFSKRMMEKVSLPYFERNTQIYPREQDLTLGKYLLSLAYDLKEKASLNTRKIKDFYGMMCARVNTLYLNAFGDIDHRTIADSVSRRVEIPELFMLFDGIINFYTGEDAEMSDFINPLSRYSSQEFIKNIKSPNINELFKKNLVNAVNNLSKKVKEFREVVYLARTHLQPAQLTTIGRFLSLTLDKLVDYTERVDGLSDGRDRVDFILDLGASLGTFFRTFVYKQSQRHWFEPFKSTQVGSSAMPYKRNPNKSERGIGLCRMIPGRVMNINQGTLTSIDYNELLLIADGLLNTFNYLFSAHGGMKINQEAISKEVDEFKYQVFQTSLLQEAGRKGAVREQAHNELRDIMFKGGGIVEIKKSNYFRELFGKDLPKIVDELYNINPIDLIGTSIEDVDASLANAQPILVKYDSLISGESKLSV